MIYNSAMNSRSMERRARAAIVLVALGGAMAPASTARAEDGACQLVDSTAGPPRQILRCPSGPLVEAETAADVHVSDPAGKGHPKGARIDAGAALIEIPKGYPGGFQISTPRAVATVRGTVWFVDVQPMRTSVFVLRGEVLVHRIGSDQTVALKKGEGVDVEDGDHPLHVDRWSPKRAAALRARFGR